MAILSNLLVNGESRLLGKLYTNDIEIGGIVNAEGGLHVGKNTAANANIYLNNKLAMRGIDAYLRINDTNAFTSGVYFGNSAVWTKGTLYIGDSSTKSTINNSSATIAVPTTFSYTANANGNVGLKVNGTATITTGNITTANTNKINNADMITTSAMDVKGKLHAVEYDLENIMDLGGSFVVAPTLIVPSSGSGTKTLTVSKSNDTTVVLTVKDPSITSTGIAGFAWANNYKVKVSGLINNTVLGTCDGYINSTNVNSNTISLTVTMDSATVTAIATTVSNYKLNIMLYNTDTSSATAVTKPLGIYLQHYQLTNNPIINVWNGQTTTPKVRIGYLGGITYNNENLGTNAQNSWGLYSDNVFLEGQIVAKGGKIGGYSIGTSNLTKGTTQNASGSFWLTPEGQSSVMSNLSSSAQTWAMTVGQNFGVTTAGSLYSISGHIGGFNIGTSAIYSTTNALGTTDNNVYIGTEGISLGTSFKVTKGGAITATSGTIGGFSMDAEMLKSGDPGTSGSVFMTKAYHGTTSIGGGSSDSWRIGAGTSFGVTNTGTLYCNDIQASGGKIGGFAIDATSIHTYNVAVTSNADNSIALSSADFTRTILSTSRSGLRFAIGDKFGVTGDGVLYTNGANITDLSASNISTGTLSAERIAVTDFTNYCQLNPNTAALYGWTLTQDSSNPNTPWYVRDTLGRDNYPSTWFDCKPGDMFKVSMTVSSTVTGATQSGGAGGTYMSINLGVQCQTATGSSNWPTLGIATSNASGTETTKTGYVTIPTSAEYIKFRAFIQIGGVAPFAGTLKIRNPVIKRVGADEYITYVNSTDGIKIHNAGDTTDYLQINSTAIKMYRNNTQKMYLDDSKLQFTNGSTVLAEYGSTVTIGETGTGKYNTYIDGNAVYMRKATTNLSKFDGDGVYFYDGSTITSQFTKNGAVIGKTSSNHVLLSGTQLQLKNNSTVLADFGSTITLGQTTGQAAVINSDGMQLYQNGYNIASFGSDIDLLNLSIYGDRGTMLIHSPISNDSRITHIYDHLYIESEVEEFVDYLISPRIKLQDILVDQNDTNTGDCKTIVISPQVGIDVNTASVLITPSGNISCQNIYCDGNLLCDNIKCGAIVGQSVPANSYKDYSVTFDSSFDDTPIVVVGIRSDLTYANIGNVSVATSSPTANGFVARVFNGSNTARNVYMHWIATTSGMQS